MIGTDWNWQKCKKLHKDPASRGEGYSHWQQGNWDGEELADSPDMQRAADFWGRTHITESVGAANITIPCISLGGKKNPFHGWQSMI